MTDLIWDIQTEHLDEAEFLLEARSRAVDSPRYTLASLAEGPDERLLARLDGLRIGGEVVVERLLLPVLDDPDDDEFRTGAASLAILQGAGLEACERVLRAFADAKREAGRRGLVQALTLTWRDGLISWLARDLDQLQGPALASRLQVLAGHRVNAGQRLCAWLGHDDLEVVRAAALLARHSGAPPALQLLHPMIGADDTALRWAAIESGLIRGQTPAWQALAPAAFEPGSPLQAGALAWLAMLGDAQVHQRLFGLLRDGPTRALLWSAGLSGRAEAVDCAVELLEHPRLGRLAAELVCAVAGLAVDDERYWLDRGRRVGEQADEALPPLAEDDLDRAPVPSRDDRLRAPNPDEVRFWWSGARASFDRALRYTNGHPLDIRQAALSLRALPTRRRHPLALELAARSSGRAQLATHALARVQGAQEQEVFGRVAFLDFQRGLPLAT